ncbi:preprotein translocase subunit SecG [Antricoccus suffuscus]|uniref:Protein-export membrane protein SecG n=1 Tax=Antricoccus suffuscus TaxID=1629062 RepID=A0A2T1A543_9ACTN|nr:preprotein translocase subunit SecG [Antricoccus suffuscus]PRZ43725.1 preprotein translocase subunit SecG [Antricoccus suffuscus]
MVDEVKLLFEIVLIAMSLALIALVLLHKGRGGGLSSMFGGSMTSQLSGSSVVEKNLNVITVFCSLIWLICIVVLGLLFKIQ